MAPRATRSKGTVAKEAVPPPATAAKYVLPAASDEAPKLFILPKKATDDARIVTLPHPRHKRPTRYLNSDLYVASPIDPLFLVLAALAATAPGAKRLFLAADDHLDALPTTHSHLADLLRRQPRVRCLLEARMAVVCDTVEAGDAPMFRLSEDRLLDTLLDKARRMAAALPASLAERFVTRPLEAPVKSVPRAEGMIPAASEPSTPASDAETASTATTATSAVSAASTVNTADTASTSPSVVDVCTAMQATPDVVALQRLRVALDYICANYVPAALATTIKARLQATAGPSSTTGRPDFAPLDAYLARLAVVRQEVAQTRSAALDYTRKRGAEAEDDDERAEKRRKQEEDERRRKAGESRGVRDLKKVNVRGMKKLSEFFKKK